MPALELLEAEMITAMGRIGITRVDQIDGAHVCRALLNKGGRPQKEQGT